MKKIKFKFNVKMLLTKYTSIVALILALIIAGFVMLFCGYNPIEAYSSIFQGAFVGKRALAQTLVQATPLIFAGLAFSVAKKSNIINLGIEGQLYMGAFGATLIALLPIQMPGIFWMSGALLFSMLFGGFYAWIVGYMKVRFGSNEVIATTMLNTIAINFVDYLTNYPLKEEGRSIAQTVKFSETVWLPALLDKSQLTVAIILAVLACVIVKWLFDCTVIGFNIRCVGRNRIASETAGIKIGSVILIAMFISGGIAGLIGGTQVLGVNHRLISGFSSGYGFDGIAVAALAADSPLGVVFSGLVFGALRAGCMVLNRTTGIPTEFIDVVQALIILLVAAPLLVKEILCAKNNKGGKKG